MFKAKFVNFASFIYLFGLTRNNNRDTLCSWICAFLFHLNLLHQLVMLGPKQLYHKKHSQEKVGKQSATERQVNYWGAQYGSVTAGRISMIHVFSPILAIIMLKLRIVSIKQIYPIQIVNFSGGEWLNCLSNSASLHQQLARSKPSWKLDVIDNGQLTPHHSPSRG